MGKLATSPLPYRGSPPLQSGGQNQKWPTSGRNGYLSPAVSGTPTASERGAGGKIRSGPQVGKSATSPLPYRGAPPLQSGGQNQKWPTVGQIGYLTLAVSGSPTAAERAAKSEVAHKCKMATSPPAVSGSPTASERGAKSEVAHKWEKLATSPLPYRGAPPLHSGGQNQKWPTIGQIGYLTLAVSGSPTAAERGANSEVAHKWAKRRPHPLPYRGAPPLQSGGQNQKWPTSGQIGYLTPAVSGSPTASQRGAKSQVAHNRANWLPHPCRIGEPHRFRARGKIRSGPQVGEKATSPPAVSGSPTASERGAKSEVAHKWANWLPHPCRIGEPHRFTAGGKIRSGPQ